MATQLEEAASGGSVDNVTVRLQMALAMEGVTYKGNSDVRRWASAGRRRVTASSPRRTVVFLAPRLPVGPLQLLLRVLRVERAEGQRPRFGGTFRALVCSITQSRLSPNSLVHFLTTAVGMQDWGYRASAGRALGNPANKLAP